MQVKFLDKNKKISQRLRQIRENLLRKTRKQIEDEYGLNGNSLKNIEYKYPDAVYIWELCKRNKWLKLEWIMEDDPDSAPQVPEEPTK